MNKKKLLLICADLHEYRNMISDEISEGLDIDVDSYLQTPAMHGLHGLINRLFIKHSRKFYYQKVLSKIELNNYDYILIIKGTAIVDEFYNKLKKVKAKKILYLWDSFDKYPRQKELIQYFDKVYTFDPNDAKKYNISFLPLFYKEKNAKKKIVYDACFIGVYHSKRYQIVKELKKYLNEFGMDMYIFIYLTTRFNYFILKYLKKELPKEAKMKDFNYTSLPKYVVDEIYNSSKVIIDIQSKNQTGLTMRTIEALGTGSKLITNNKDIKNYDFFNSNNIYCMNTSNLDIPIEFFESDYEDVKEEIKNRYSLKNWVERIIEDD